jgi:hypothetical protein
VAQWAAGALVGAAEAEALALAGDRPDGGEFDEGRAFTGATARAQDKGKILR